MLMFEEFADGGRIVPPNTLDTGDMKMFPNADAPDPSCNFPPPSEKRAQPNVGGETLISVLNHRSAETPIAGIRGLSAATVHVFVPKVRLVAVIPEAEYPNHS